MVETKKQSLREEFWNKYGRMCKRAIRKRNGMNLSRISALTKAGQDVAVADKVLGSGKLTHAVNICALGFSQSAKEMIKKAGGKIVSAADMKKKSPKGENVKMLI